MNTVVITGVSRGLGRITAEMFAEKGWQVLGVGRSDRPADLHQSIQYYQFDAADANACMEFWEKITKDHQKIHLINNAGGYVHGRVTDVPPADFQDQMTGNYFTGVFMTQGLLRHVPKAKIVNIISSGALHTHAGQSAYG